MLQINTADNVWMTAWLQNIETDVTMTNSMRTFAERHVPPAADAALSKWRLSEASSAACTQQHLVERSSAGGINCMTHHDHDVSAGASRGCSYLSSTPGS